MKTIQKEDYDWMINRRYLIRRLTDDGLLSRWAIKDCCTGETYAKEHLHCYPDDVFSSEPWLEHNSCLWVVAQGSGIPPYKLATILVECIRLDKSWATTSDKAKARLDLYFVGARIAWRFISCIYRKSEPRGPLLTVVNRTSGCIGIGLLHF